VCNINFISITSTLITFIYSTYQYRCVYLSISTFTSRMLYISSTLSVFVLFSVTTYSERSLGKVNASSEFSSQLSL